MGFSITSALIGGVVIICCSLSIEFFRWRKEYLLSRVEDPTLLDEKLENYDAEMVIIVIILVLGIGNDVNMFLFDETLHMLLML